MFLLLADSLKKKNLVLKLGKFGTNILNSS